MIVARQLRVTLGGREVLDGVSFEVARGDALALVGPNGSGKTTILRVLLGLCPHRGSASIGGHDVTRAPVAARELCGYVPQRPAFGDASAREALAFVAALRKIRRARVDEVLELVGLTPHAREAARTFSGGMQQRLSFALALLADPPVLLLDEPTASLDRAARADFVALVRGLRERGRTLLLASHRADEILQLTDARLVLEDGRVVERKPSRPAGDAHNIVPLRRGIA